MGLSHQHELHTRRKGRNVGVGLLLAAFIALIFALTFVKVQQEGFAMQNMDAEAASE
jgi:hypothetical protein